MKKQEEKPIICYFIYYFIGSEKFSKPTMKKGEKNWILI